MIIGPTTHTRINACLACGERLDAATPIGHERPPAEGDVSICVACGHLMLFERDGTLRNPTAAESAEFNMPPEGMAVLHAIAHRKQTH